MKKTHRLILLTTLFLLHIIGLNAQRPFITEWVTHDGEIGIVGSNVLSPYDYTITIENKNNLGVFIGGAPLQVNSSMVSFSGLPNGDTLLVSIIGDFPSINLTNNPSLASKLTKIVQWGNIVWKNLKYDF